MYRIHLKLCFARSSLFICLPDYIPVCSLPTCIVLPRPNPSPCSHNEIKTSPRIANYSTQFHFAFLVLPSQHHRVAGSSPRPKLSSIWPFPWAELRDIVLLPFVLLALRDPAHQRATSNINRRIPNGCYATALQQAYRVKERLSV